jgi:YgiT-type zinc finger domain-containing protein
MKCRTCGAALKAAVTDLPFTMQANRIVILKGLPVLQCGQCGDYLIEDAVMVRVDELLARADSSAELEVLRYAA